MIGEYYSLLKAKEYDLLLEKVKKLELMLSDRILKASYDLK